MIIIENDDHNDFLLREIEKSPDSVFISTFGVYLGITYDGSDTSEWGHKYVCNSRAVADALKSIKDVKILVGLSNYISCKGKNRCLDCEAQYSKGLIRLMNHVEFFPEFSWRMMCDLHLKCFLFGFGGRFSGAAGGRNFTGSNWRDLTFSLSEDDCLTVREYVLKYWDSAMPVENVSIESFLFSQGISEEGFLRAGER